VSKLWRDRRAAFGAAVLAIVTGAAVAGPLISTGSPTVQHDVVATRFLRPLATDHAGTFHPLGTDRFGRDVWTRLVHGGRVSLAVGALAVLLSVVIGVAVAAPRVFGRAPCVLRCSRSQTSSSRSHAWFCCCCSRPWPGRARCWSS